MKQLYCENCKADVGFKRDLGWGTFFAVIITFGLWLFAIPFYPLRCKRCGSKIKITRTPKPTITPAVNSISSPWYTKRWTIVVIIGFWILLWSIFSQQTRQTIQPQTQQTNQPQNVKGIEKNRTTVSRAHNTENNKLRNSLAYISKDKETFGDITWIEYGSDYIVIGFNIKKAKEYAKQDALNITQTAYEEINHAVAGAALNVNADTEEPILIYAVDEKYKNWSLNKPCIGWVVANGGHDGKWGRIIRRQGFGLPRIDRK